MNRRSSTLRCAIVVSVFVVMCMTRLAPAAIISFAGREAGIAGNNNDAVESWRTTTVTKTYDADGDNIYGTAGYVAYAIDAETNGNAGAVTTTNPLTYNASATRRTLSSIPSYLTLTTTNQNQIASSYGYRLIDDPSLAPGATVANVESGAALRGSVPLGTETGMLTFTVGAGFPVDGLRLGILTNNTDAYVGTIRLTQTTGGSATLTTTQSVNSSLDLYFFDIKEAALGDVFTLFLMKNNPQTGGGNTNANVIYGGLTFDAIPAVPEPSTYAAIGLSALVLVTLRRRRAAISV